MKPFNPSLHNVEFCSSANTAIDIDCANIFITNETVYIMPLPPSAVTEASFALICYWLSRGEPLPNPSQSELFSSFNSVQCQIDFIFLDAWSFGWCCAEKSSAQCCYRDWTRESSAGGGERVNLLKISWWEVLTSHTLSHRAQQVNWASAARLSANVIWSWHEAEGEALPPCNYDLCQDRLENFFKYHWKALSIHQLRLMEGNWWPGARSIMPIIEAGAALVGRIIPIQWSLWRSPSSMCMKFPLD